MAKIVKTTFCCDWCSAEVPVIREGDEEIGRFAAFATLSFTGIVNSGMGFRNEELCCDCRNAVLDLRESTIKESGQ